MHATDILVLAIAAAVLIGIVAWLVRSRKEETQKVAPMTTPPAPQPTSAASPATSAPKAPVLYLPVTLDEKAYAVPAHAVVEIKIPFGSLCALAWKAWWALFLVWGPLTLIAWFIVALMTGQIR